MSKFMVIPLRPFPAPRMTRYSKFTDRAQQYARWKRDVSWFCKINGFSLPDSQLNLSFRFQTRHPGRWGEPHSFKPDLDNLVKAFFDALCSRDQTVTQFSCDKKWSERDEIIVEWAA